MLEKSLSSMIRQLTKDFSSSSYLTLILMIWSNKSKEVFSIVPKPDIPALLTLKWIIAINKLLCIKICERKFYNAKASS